MKFRIFNPTDGIKSSKIINFMIVNNYQNAGETTTDLESRSLFYMAFLLPRTRKADR